MLFNRIMKTQVAFDGFKFRWRIRLLSMALKLTFDVGVAGKSKNFILEIKILRCLPKTSNSLKTSLHEKRDTEIEKFSNSLEQLLVDLHELDLLTTSCYLTNCRI